MKTEVLAPAGSKEGLLAALYAGADAVYTGGRMFGARAYAKNLSDEELLKCIDYCHLHEKKLYLTVNTLFKEEELAQLADWIVPFYENGLDAVIVQDLGVLRMLKREFPLLELHASTQMSIHSAAGARLMEKLGVARIVPARELSLSEIEKIRRETSLEIECFVHGALCYSYSGQCLMSSLIGGRSGNRGRCAQPCRLPWSYDRGQEGFLLSPKDICTLEILPDILDAGVDSLKIEGRMKRTEYAAGVSALYRKYVDLYREKGREHYRVEPEDIRDLKDLYNRGGFSTGYYQRYNGVSMMSTKRQNHFGTEAAKLLKQNGRQTLWKALEPLAPKDMLESCEMKEAVMPGKQFSLTLKDRRRLAPGTIWNRTCNAVLMASLKEQYTDRLLQEKINGKLMIFPGKPAILSVISKGKRVTAEGAVICEAQKKPLTEENVRKQILRTGNTPYTFEKLDVFLGESCFMPLQSLNELRRAALEELENAQLSEFKRSFLRKRVELPEGKHSEKRVSGKKKEFSISLENAEVLPKLSEYAGISRIYLDSKCFAKIPSEEEMQDMLLPCRRRNIECWYILPVIFRSRTEEVYREQKEWLSCFDGILVKNPEEIQFLKEIGYQGKTASDYSFYSFNREAREMLFELGVSFTTCPVELNLRELAGNCGTDSELVIYGRLPLMTSAQCLQKTMGKCSRTPGIHYLKDRKGKQFPVRNCCAECYNVIYNSVPVSLHGMTEEIKRLAPDSVRLMFTVETPGEILEITEQFLREYKAADELSACFESVPENSVRKRTVKEADYEFTRGHYRRGVE